MPGNTDKHVRFFFSITIPCTIPSNPEQKPGADRDAKWERKFLENVSARLETVLSGEGFAVAYRQHCPMDAASRLYAAEFNLSAVLAFPAAQVFTPKAGSGGFSVRAKPFSTAKAEIASRVERLCKQDFAGSAVEYKYAASRFYTFEIYYAGYLTIRHLVSSEDIADAESVEEAIACRYSEIMSELEPNWSCVFPEPPESLPENDLYEFEIALTRYTLFSEDDVYGSVAWLPMDISQKETSGLDVDFKDELVSSLVESERGQLQYDCEEILPPGSELVSCSISFVDWDDEVFEISDDLVGSGRPPEARGTLPRGDRAGQKASD